MEKRPRKRISSQVDAAASSDDENGSLDRSRGRASDDDFVSEDDHCDDSGQNCVVTPPLHTAEAAVAADAAENEDEADDDVLVTVPNMNRVVFASWVEMFAHLHEHETATHQALMVRTSTSVKTRNKRILQDGGSPTQLLPLHYIRYSVSLVCTHHGEHRSRGTGQRPRQEVRAMNCPFKMSATLKRVAGSPPPYAHNVTVTEKNLVHNHPVNQETFMRYAHKRIQLDPETLALVEVLRRAGSKNVKILDREAKGKARDGLTVEQRIERWVEEFSADGNIGRVFVNDSKIATAITLQTQHMRQMFASFPEVLLIDASHGTNSANYKLFSFMIHDTNGKGQHVHHSLVENERSETLETVIEQFKTANPGWKSVECIVIDKDFTEMLVLRRCFPSARILLCQFHVIKYLYEEVAKTGYGFTTWQKERVKGAIDRLVYACTERAYDKAYNYFCTVLAGASAAVNTPVVVNGTDSNGDATDRNCGATDRTFLAYFNTNWQSCREMWCSYARQNVTTLGNNTNNRLESSWKRLKEIVHKIMELDECIFGIIYHQSLCESAYNDSLLRLGTLSVHGYDREMLQFANVVSKHACSLVEQQYDYAISTSRYRFYGVQEDMYFVCSREDEDEKAQDEPGSEYAVDTDTWVCSCLFSVTRRLPCRHVFFIRKQWKTEKRVETTIPFSHINPRWVLNIQARKVPIPPPPQTAFNVLPVKKRVLNGLPPNVKYRLASDASRTIGQALSELGTREFGGALLVYENIAALFKQKLHHQLEEVLKSAFRGVPGTTWSHVPAAPSTDGVERLDDERLDDERLDDDDYEDDELGELFVEDEAEAGSVAPPTQSVEVPIDQILSLSSQATQDSITADIAALNTQELIDEVATDVNDDLALTPDWIVAPNLPPKGRPKTKQKAKQQKKRQRRDTARQEADVLENQLSLQSVMHTLLGEPTYGSAAFVLCQFGVQEMPRKMKKPIARDATPTNRSKVAASTKVLSILPATVIKTCYEKISTKQARDRGRTGITVPEEKIVVEIPTVAWYTPDQLRSMRLWHRAREAIDMIDEASAWLGGDDDEGKRRLKELKILSEQRWILDFRVKNELSDAAIELAMSALFEEYEMILAVMATKLGISFDISLLSQHVLSTILADSESFTLILLPVLIKGNHWCGVAVDKVAQTITMYDPIGADYQILKNFVDHKLAPCFKHAYRRHKYNSASSQLDSYNCGVFLLLFFEASAFGSCIDHGAKSLQDHRRRFMRTWLLKTFKKTTQQ